MKTTRHCLTLLRADEGSCTSTLATSKPWLSYKILPEAASWNFTLYT